MAALALWAEIQSKTSFRSASASAAQTIFANYALPA